MDCRHVMSLHVDNIFSTPFLFELKYFISLALLHHIWWRRTGSKACCLLTCYYMTYYDSSVSESV